MKKLYRNKEGIALFSEGELEVSLTDAEEIYDLSDLSEDKVDEIRRRPREGRRYASKKRRLQLPIEVS